MIMIMKNRGKDYCKCGTPIRDREEEDYSTINQILHLTKSKIRPSRYVQNHAQTNYICYPIKFDVLNSVELLKIKFEVSLNHSPMSRN